MSCLSAGYKLTYCYASTNNNFPLAGSCQRPLVSLIMAVAAGWMLQTDARGLAIIHATHAIHTHPSYTRHSHSSKLHTPFTLIHATHATHTHPSYTCHSHSSMLHTPLTLIHATHATHTHPCLSSFPFTHSDAIQRTVWAK